MFSKSYSIYPGVKITLLDIHMYHYDKEIASGGNVIEINHCYQGRYECEFEGDCFYYMGEGNLFVSRLSATKIHQGFPIGYYAGMNILIDLDQCDQRFIALMTEFGIDYMQLIERWKTILPCKIFEESKEISHIFDELYDPDNMNNPDYMKLKVLELLMFFQNHQEKMKHTQLHFAKVQVKKVKQIKSSLETDLESEITLADLAEQYQISESSIKRCFHAIYGMSPSQYRKRFRMQTAARLLIETEQNVADIGMQVGYLNPSKFANAFSDVMHLSPKEYRIEKIIQ